MKVKSLIRNFSYSVCCSLWRNLLSKSILEFHGDLSLFFKFVSKLVPLKNLDPDALIFLNEIFQLVLCVLLLEFEALLSVLKLVKSLQKLLLLLLYGFLLG